MEYNDILKRAFEAMDNAYAPYSKYHVGQRTGNDF